MELTMEWNMICRICLQEGDMLSIFDTDEDLIIADKIMMCSNLKIVQGQNLPEHICEKCFNDLRVAYNFRSNCESSNNVLQAFAKGDIVNDLVLCSVKGKLYKYEPPAGLNVKRIKRPITPPNPIEVDNDQENDIFEDNLVVPKLEMQEDEIITNDYEHMNLNEVEETSIQYEITEIDEVTSDDNVVELPLQIEHLTKKTTSPKKPNLGTRHNRTKAEKTLCICELCGNSFKYKHALETHMRRHRNEKPFPCEICGRAFVLNVELTCHMRTHTGQKPYACRYCDRRFSDFGSRIKHERSHTGERPYACDTCGKAFAYSYGLSSHILTHTGEKPHKCEKCGKRFTKKHHLTNHLKTHLKQELKMLSMETISRKKRKNNQAISPEEVLDISQGTDEGTNQQLTILEGESETNVEDFDDYEAKPIIIFETEDINSL